MFMCCYSLKFFWCSAAPCWRYSEQTSTQQREPLSSLGLFYLVFFMLPAPRAPPLLSPNGVLLEVRPAGNQAGSPLDPAERTALSTSMMWDRCERDDEARSRSVSGVLMSMCSESSLRYYYFHNLLERNDSWRDLQPLYAAIQSGNCLTIWLNLYFVFLPYRGKKKCLFIPWWKFPFWRPI